MDPAFSVRSGIANSGILKSYLGLLCLGQNDFDAIEGQRKDAFFARALGLRAVPSSPTLRQRMDTHAASWFDLADELNAAVLGMKIAGKSVDFGVPPCGYMPLDVDTFACANSGTVKEHVGRTYAGVDGYCPLAAYLGTPGFCLELALRPGTQHSASETEYNIKRVPSGKFDTNYLVCALAAVATSLLRLVGQHTLHEPDAPVRHTTQRRKIRTVIQELMFNAARMVHHARQWVLGLGTNDRAFAVFERHGCHWCRQAHTRIVKWVHTQALVRPRTAHLAKRWANACGVARCGGHVAQVR